MTWNVEGLRTCLADDEFLNFVSQFELVFCSETWQKHNDTFSIEGYNCISLPRPESFRIKRRGRRGHWGICLFIKHTIADGIEVVEKNESDFIWVKMNRQYFGLSSDLFACFCYIPPKESIYYRNVDIDFYDFLENGIRQYADLGKVAVFGDLNARTGVLNDNVVSCEGLGNYIHCINGADISDNGAKSKICRRYSLDTKTNSSGLRLIQLCKDSDMCIVNGRIGQDKGIGQFTFQGTQGSSLIDYVLLTPDFMDNISDFVVYDITSFSDHTPVEISFEANYQPTGIDEKIEVEKLIWNSCDISQFRELLSNNLIDIDLLVDRILNDNLSIDDGVSSFGAILYNKAFEIFGHKKIIHNGESSAQRKICSKWFNNDCVIARAELKRANKLFRKYRSHEYHELVVSSRKNYRKVKRRARAIFKQGERQRLHKMASDNPK